MLCARPESVPTAPLHHRPDASDCRRCVRGFVRRYMCERKPIIAHAQRTRTCTTKREQTSRASPSRHHSETGRAHVASHNMPSPAATTCLAKAVSCCACPRNVSEREKHKVQRLQALTATLQSCQCAYPPHRTHCALKQTRTASFPPLRHSLLGQS